MKFSFAILASLLAFVSADGDASEAVVGVRYCRGFCTYQYQMAFDRTAEECQDLHPKDYGTCLANYQTEILKTRSDCQDVCSLESNEDCAQDCFDKWVAVDACYDKDPSTECMYRGYKERVAYPFYNCWEGCKQY